MVKMPGCGSSIASSSSTVFAVKLLLIILHQAFHFSFSVVVCLMAFGSFIKEYQRSFLWTTVVILYLVGTISFNPSDADSPRVPRMMGREK